MNDLRDLYQEVILDHGKSPRNFHEMTNADCHAEGFNPLCGDRITLFIKFAGDQIVDVSFQGAGCAISTASASLLTDFVKGKNKQEAEQLFHDFHEAIMGKGNWDNLDKLMILSGVKEFPMRVKCATLPWHTLHAALNKDATTVTTE